MENNFILYGIEPLISEKMFNDGTVGGKQLEDFCDFRREAVKAARRLVPSSPREVLELFHSVQRMAEKHEYKSRTGLGWADVVEAARDIVEKAFLELAEEVAHEEYAGYIDSAYI